jgi:hypothetical protein
MSGASTHSTRKKAWKAKFIDALAETGNVAAAARIACVSRDLPYKGRPHDREFVKAWDSAMETSTDKLEAIARQRAMDTSDTLLIFLLKAHRPEKYRERVGVDCHQTGAVTVHVVYDDIAGDTPAVITD